MIITNRLKSGPSSAWLRNLCFFPLDYILLFPCSWGYLHLLHQISPQHVFWKAQGAAKSSFSLTTGIVTESPCLSSPAGPSLWHWMLCQQAPSHWWGKGVPSQCWCRGARGGLPSPGVKGEGCLSPPQRIGRPQPPSLETFRVEWTRACAPDLHLLFHPAILVAPAFTFNI